MTKQRLKHKEEKATQKEISSLRAINGAANWLSSQSRPDLSAQTAFSQQCFPDPKVKDLMFANQLVHRARQYSDTEVRVKHIPWDDLCICFHFDAGIGNAKEHKTQAGYVIAFAEKTFENNEPSVWSPCAWPSYKLPRVVASTVAGEAQAYSTASAVAEWVSLLLAEARHGRFDLRTKAQMSELPSVMKAVAEKLLDHVKRVPIVGITDCKSLYDNLQSTSSISTCEDKRVAIVTTNWFGS